MILKEKVNQHLEKIYQGYNLEEAKKLFAQLVENFPSHKELEHPTHKTTYLITYGDSFYDRDRAPLKVLREVISDKLPNFTDVHILPMFPYSSDDGFSVIDYLNINPALGNWQDIKALANEKRLMFDFVCNHMSQSSDWFKRFLNGEPDFENAFIKYDKNFDTSRTIRPRVSPLFHEFTNIKNEKIKVWTTFSKDQVDTNVSDPQMLARLTEVLLEYVKLGASSIRLDAIGFMWKESGTTNMHLPQTHEIIKLWRMLLDELRTNVQIVTETNVPQEQNLSYFGNGNDEASMVYQFPLPPLVLHTFISENATKLTEWAKTISSVSKTATYFNFLASHDGIGLRPTEGILTDKERETIVQLVLKNGGRISYKNNPDGSKSPYELNISYASALESSEKMLAAHAILLSFVGVPAIYYHSIFGSKNDIRAVEESGMARRINRKKLGKTELYQELESNVYRKKVYEGISNLIAIRKGEEDFDPYGDQEVLDVGEKIFALKRGNITVLVNVSSKLQEVPIKGYDLIRKMNFNGQLEAYQYVWIK